MKVFQTLGDGRWFPGRGPVLKAMIQSFLNAAEPAACQSGRLPIVAGIAPHAGYAYSGAVAGNTYRALQESSRHGNGPDLVVVLGFPHRASLHGLAWLDADVIRTPAGDMAADRPFMNQVQSLLPNTFFDEACHAGEHSAENQLPFIQIALPGVPVAVGLLGGHSVGWTTALAGAMREAAAGRRVCLLASTDLLHDADYKRVVSCDEKTLLMMERLDSEGLNRAWSYETQICCGISPVLAALEWARASTCHCGRLLFYCNSGDIDPAGRGQWVVGYGSMVFESEAT